MYLVKYFRHDAEVETLRAFMRWQQKDTEFQETREVLRIGHGSPMLFFEDELLATGFKKIVEYWSKEGLFLC